MYRFNCTSPIDILVANSLQQVTERVGMRSLLMQAARPMRLFVTKSCLHRVCEKGKSPVFFSVVFYLVCVDWR